MPVHPFCPYHFVQYHFLPNTILSILFCPYHFVRYLFVQSLFRTSSEICNSLWLYTTTTRNDRLLMLTSTAMSAFHGTSEHCLNLDLSPYKSHFAIENIVNDAAQIVIE